MNQLVGNLLDLSRIEGGSLKPHMSWHDLYTVIDDTVERLRPVTRRHHLRVNVPHGLAHIWFDAVLPARLLGDAPVSWIDADSCSAGDCVRARHAISRGRWSPLTPPSRCGAR